MSSVANRVREATGAESSYPELKPIIESLSDPGIPLLHEDEGYEDMGDADVHTRTCGILFYGLQFHLSDRPGYRTFCNLNLHYSKMDPTAYISPDIMVVEAWKKLPENLRSYRIGEDGPAPVFVAEVLSERTFQQRDLTDKPLIYAEMKVAEYALVDVPGQYLSVRLLLKTLLRGGGWKDKRDADGGITSGLGFRVVLDPDGQIRVINGKSGKAYLRPMEAQMAVDAVEQANESLREAKERIRALQAEVARLRGARKRKKK